VYEAEDLSHTSGRRVEDAAASGGAAWEAVEGRDRGGVHIVWGPYQLLPPGEYVAYFRVRGSIPPEAPLRLDVFDYFATKEGKDGVLGQLTLAADQLAEQYADVALGFKRTEEGKSEYRVWWPGRGKVVVDRAIVARRTSR